MSIEWSDEVVRQVDDHWRDRLRPRLDGLTDEEFLWEPVPGCWSLRRRSESRTSSPIGAGEYVMDYSDSPPDHGPVTTIAWRLAHLIDVLGSPSEPHFQRAPADEPPTEFAGTAATALRQLDEVFEAWLADVRVLGVDGLARPQGALSPPQFHEATIAQLVMYTHVEVIHHGAEICLLRDLYRGSW